MLISRGLGALLLALTAKATVLPDRHFLPRLNAQVQISQGEGLETRVAKGDGAEQEQGDGSTPSLGLRSGEGTIWGPAGRNRRLHTRDDVSGCCATGTGAVECCGEGFACCLAGDGQVACCPVSSTSCEDGFCSQSSTATPISTVVGAAGDSTVFVTQTLTSTITLFTGAPTTSVVTATSTIVITFLNPTQQVQTATVTATNFVQKARRAIEDAEAGNVAQHAARHGSVTTDRVSRARRTAEKRLEPIIVTSTITTEVFTTTFARNVVFATITHNIFSTLLVAPNAVTTVFVTTTVFLPSGAIPTTAAPTATPVTPGNPSAALPTTGNAATTLKPPLSSGATTFFSPSRLPPTSLPPTSSPSTSVSESTTMTMQTMLNPSSTSSATTTTGSLVPTPPLQPAPEATPPAFTSTQIAGITIGSIFGLLFLILLAFLLRLLVQRRRAAQAQMRQQLTPPEDGATGAAAAARNVGPGGGGRGGGGVGLGIALARGRGRGREGGAATGAAALATGGSDSSGASAPSGHSMLTGEGEVRIVIRPAPKRRTQSSQLWPMPPGHRGRTYSLFVEEGTTTAGATTAGETTPQDPGEWSIASERGSVGDGATSRQGNTTAGNNDGNTTVYTTLDPGYGDRGSGSGGRPPTSLWELETSFGARSEGSSYPGASTLLTPPPARRGFEQPMDPADIMGGDHDRGGPSGNGGRREGSSSGGGGYPQESLGIGKAW